MDGNLGAHHSTPRGIRSRVLGTLYSLSNSGSKAMLQPQQLRELLESVPPPGRGEGRRLPCSWPAPGGALGHLPPPPPACAGGGGGVGWAESLFFSTGKAHS